MSNPLSRLWDRCFGTWNQFARAKYIIAWAEHGNETITIVLQRSKKNGRRVVVYPGVQAARRKTWKGMEVYQDALVWQSGGELPYQFDYIQEDVVDREYDWSEFKQDFSVEEADDKNKT